MRMRKRTNEEESETRRRVKRGHTATYENESETRAHGDLRKQC